jgi:hypothetical protein
MAFDLRDDFITDRAAGAVNGTAAEPGPGGNRAVTDTESKVTIASGLLTFAGGKASPAWNDPQNSYGDDAREPGLIIINTINWTTHNIGPVFGVHSICGGYQNVSILWAYPPNVRVTTVETAKDYRIITIARDAGFYLFCYSPNAGYSKHTLLYIHNADNTATLPVKITNYSSVFTSDTIRIPSTRWLPTPLASDGFSSAGITDGLGHAEGIAGGIGSGGDGKTWVGATWSVSGGKAVNTPTLGSELSSGTLTIGTWYRIIASEANHFYTGSAIADVFRATAETALDANNKVKAITLSTLFQTIDESTEETYQSIEATIVDHFHGGVVACMDSAATPANFLVAYFDQRIDKVVLDKCVGGTYTNLLNVAMTYLVGVTLVMRTRMVATGIEVYVWYNNNYIGTATVTDAEIISNTIHGLFSTGEPTKVQLDDYFCFPTTSDENSAKLDYLYLTGGSNRKMNIELGLNN